MNYKQEVATKAFFLGREKYNQTRFTSWWEVLVQMMSSSIMIGPEGLGSGSAVKVEMTIKIQNN